MGVGEPGTGGAVLSPPWDRLALGVGEPGMVVGRAGLSCPPHWQVWLALTKEIVETQVDKPRTSRTLHAVQVHTPEQHTWDGQTG